MAENLTIQPSTPELPLQEAGGLVPLVSQEVVPDRDGFDRVHFHLSDGATVIFRGKEDLPNLAIANAHIVTPDEPPLHREPDSFDSWSRALEAQPTDQALNPTYIASNTPLGIVDMAKLLVDRGLGDSSRSKGLVALRQKIVSRNIDEEALSLFDDIYASSCEKNPLPISDGLASDGPMVVALSLAGDKEASQVLQQRKQHIASQDKYRTGLDRKLPGQKLSLSELQTLADAHFVAVHTTHSRVDPNGSIELHSAGDNNLSKEDSLPRSTVHWSLNHPVESHVFGDFSGRATTIVVPMEKLVKENGAPAVLEGVDTYFSLNPGQGLHIPNEATIIELNQNEQEPFVVQSGNHIVVRTSKITSRDLQQLASFCENDQSNPGSYTAFAKELIQCDSELEWDLRVLDANPDGFDEELIIPHRLQRLNTLRPLSTLIRSRIDNQPNETEQDALAAVMEDLINGGLKIEQYPELVPFFIELTRNTLVRNAISLYDGKLVKGGERSVKDKQFETVQHETAEALGLRKGLHEFQPESGLEWAFRDLFTSSYRPDPGTAEFYKTERDLWLSVYRAPVQTRRMAVAFGLITFPPPVSITESVEVSSDTSEDHPLSIKTDLGKTAIYDNHW